MRVYLLIFGAFLISELCGAQPLNALLPKPAETRWGSGRLALQKPLVAAFEPTASPLVRAAVQRTLARLTPPQPTTSPTRQATNPPGLQIRYGREGQPENFDEEQYSLRITPAGVLIDAPTSLGVLRALATLEQLPLTEKKRRYLPEADIRDTPRFAWRGLLLDPVRHFLPVPVIKRNLDGMAAAKLNVLHWHLSDDQGFRVESRLFPLLHTASGGGFYTQADVREVLAYAAARGIRVLPEFDVPSHTTAWMVAYPRLATPDTVYRPYQSWRTTNVGLDPTRETTYSFLDSLLTEMSGLFPDPYFHAGGDEFNGKQWLRSPPVADFMRTHAMFKADGKTLDPHQLHTYFNRRVLAILQQQGKTMVGWDEILGPDLPAPVVIQSWRGKKGLAEAARQGHPALLSHGYYLDLNYSAAAAYAADPLPPDVPLDAAQRARIRGGEAALWGEFADSVVVDSRVWPRAAAVAERLWSARETTQDVPDMYRRLHLFAAQLEGLGLRHRAAPAALLMALATPPPPDTLGYVPPAFPRKTRKLSAPLFLLPLSNLAAIIEPVKDYKRHFQGLTYTSQTPLNRLVDAAPAEAETARRYGATVDSLLAGFAAAPRPPGLARQVLRLRLQLARWQALDAQLQPLFALSAGVREYAPLAAGLTVVATVALERLAQLETGVAAAPAWLAAARTTLDAAQKPAGQAELAVVRATRRLAGLP